MPSDNQHNLPDPPPSHIRHLRAHLASERPRQPVMEAHVAALREVLAFAARTKLIAFSTAARIEEMGWPKPDGDIAAAVRRPSPTSSSASSGKPSGLRTTRPSTAVEGPFVLKEPHRGGVFASPRWARSPCPAPATVTMAGLDLTPLPGSELIEEGLCDLAEDRESVAAVLHGWRSSTTDVDLVFVPDQDAFLLELAQLKERLAINVEIASPARFLPKLRGWRERCVFIGR